MISRIHQSFRKGLPQVHPHNRPILREFWLYPLIAVDLSPERLQSPQGEDEVSDISGLE